MRVCHSRLRTVSSERCITNQPFFTILKNWFLFLVLFLFSMFIFLWITLLLFVGVSTKLLATWYNFYPEIICTIIIPSFVFDSKVQSLLYILGTHRCILLLIPNKWRYNISIMMAMTQLPSHIVNWKCHASNKSHERCRHQSIFGIFISACLGSGMYILSISAQMEENNTVSISNHVLQTKTFLVWQILTQTVDENKVTNDNNNVLKKYMFPLPLGPLNGQAVALSKCRKNEDSLL
jgi:hypothetical protein